MEALLSPYPIISTLSTHLTQDDLINLSLTSPLSQALLYSTSPTHWKNLYAKTAPVSCRFSGTRSGYHRFSVALKELPVGRCIRCFVAVCKGCVFDTSLHKHLSNWMRACTLGKRLRWVCVGCEVRGGDGGRRVLRVKVCACEGRGVWICAGCSADVEVRDDLFRREQQQRRSGVEKGKEKGGCGCGEAEKVVVCGWCEGLVSDA